MSFDAELKQLECNFSVVETVKFCCRWLKKDLRLTDTQRNIIMTTMVSDLFPVSMLNLLDHRLSKIINILLDLYEDGRVVEMYAREILRYSRRRFDIDTIKQFAYIRKYMSFYELIRISQSTIKMNTYLQKYSCFPYKVIYVVLTTSAYHQ